ncbi:MAG TPA: ATP-binding protein [Steroidobacteraceae bacterium]|nr:ATP-binding protein [Steroidobacteraceae bacterium]
MDAPTLKRAASAVTVGIGGLLWLAAILFMAQTAQNSEQFSRLHPWILMINIAGLAVLVGLLATKLAQLIRDWRGHVIGSRLKARMVWIFGVLATLPILLVYFFAVQFLNRGIDSWFNVEIRRSLDDALVLSRSALEVRMREHLADSQLVAEGLGTSSATMPGMLESFRRQVGALELTVATEAGSIIAVSNGVSAAIVPEDVPSEVLLQVRQGQPFVSLEPQSAGGYLIRTAVPIAPDLPGRERLVLQGLYPVAERLGALADTVQAAYKQFGEKDYLRQPLKASFILTLTVVLLLSLLAAWYGAIFTAQRLVQPIQDLVQGTRAVAQGDLDTKLPLTSHDEMGFLVHSFNDMTKRLRRAREESRRAQQEVETERANLAVILARLSTGVISLERDWRIRTANRAASMILGEELETQVGQGFDAIGAEPHGIARQFVDACRQRFAGGATEWREQFTFQSGMTRRILMCACTPLPGEGDEPGGHVLVFDDITVMLQAQREAAWGEVARRLAHEIKNPLTPIRLSAERMRHRLLPSMTDAKDAQMLERATQTIVQQVEAMKEMVNAFSEYARAPRLEMTTVDLNRMVTEVTDLYRAQGAMRNVRFKVTLDPAIDTVVADAGRLRQLLNNLLTNAVEALEGQGEGSIAVTTQRALRGETEVVEIAVEDDGPGFQREMIGQVFDPYVTTKAKGTGLGLAIVRKIVEEHGGHIEADNRATGGARVCVDLPLHDTGRAGNNRTFEPRRERA